MAIFLDGEGRDSYLGIAPARADEGPPNLSLFIDVGESENHFDAVDYEADCTTGESLSIALLASSADAINLSSCTP